MTRRRQQGEEEKERIRETPAIRRRLIEVFARKYSNDRHITLFYYIHSLVGANVLETQSTRFWLSNVTLLSWEELS